MIYIDRNKVTEPEILTRPFPDGKTETEKVMEYYENWDGDKQYPFSRYSKDEVKEKLEELFHGKCAYCESDFRHVSPEDIEHWRPKGAVILEDGSEQKPAYYWLAATWTNLLPSCPDCNRKRRQEDVRDPSNAQSGKKNHFPVKNEDNRWTHPDQVNMNGEVPLLLDPCSDEPSDFLIVNEEAVANEKKPANTIENKRARASIDVYGLNRSYLVKERKEHRDRILALFNDIKNYARILEIIPAGADRDKFLSDLMTKLEALKKEQQPDSRYLLMKIPIIEEFMRINGPIIQQYLTN